MCTALLPLGVNPITVNKYITSYINTECWCVQLPGIFTENLNSNSTMITVTRRMVPQAQWLVLLLSVLITAAALLAFCECVLGAVT